MEPMRLNSRDCMKEKNEKKNSVTAFRNTLFQRVYNFFVSSQILLHTKRIQSKQSFTIIWTQWMHYVFVYKIKRNAMPTNVSRKHQHNRSNVWNRTKYSLQAIMKKGKLLVMDSIWRLIHTKFVWRSN